jgi:phosphatidylserine/phosphatidylglycerophosphate/cardiolipin synthase-like enzyme
MENLQGLEVPYLQQPRLWRPIHLNIDIQVITYHRSTFGTFHSKFMTVDRKYAVISSNNIQVCQVHNLNIIL